MATNKPRFSVTFTDESFQKIQAYQKQNNIATQSKAVAKLVEIAIHEIEGCSDVQSPLPITDAALTLAKDYDGLDPHGKKVVRTVADGEKKRMAAEQAARAASLPREKPKRFVIKKNKSIRDEIPEEEWRQYLDTPVAARNGGLLKLDEDMAKDLALLARYMKREEGDGD